MSAKKGERRYDKHGEFRWLAEAEGWVLCRRKGGMTFAIIRKDWDTLSREPVECNDHSAPRWTGWGLLV